MLWKWNTKTSNDWRSVIQARQMERFEKQNLASSLIHAKLRKFGMIWRTIKASNSFKIRQLHMSWILGVQKANNLPKSAYSITPGKWCSKNSLKFVYENIRLKFLPVFTVRCLSFFLILFTQTRWQYPTVNKGCHLPYPILLNNHDQLHLSFKPT